MSALWMLYAVAVAAMLSVGALAAERALRAAGRPARGAWIAAVVGSWAFPVMALLGWIGGAPAAHATPTATFTATEITVTEVAAVQGGPAAVPWWETVVPAAREALVAPGVTRAITLGWIVAAALGLLVVGVSVARLLSRSRRWPTASVLDEPVRLSPDFGPAVLGVVRPSIVLPRWILSLGDAPLRLVLAHEREHRSARDTLVLTAATVAALAAPWNLPLWWQLRRLRMAVEMDCDRRVLGRGAPVREYGELLMTVGGRISHLAVPAAALSEDSSFLERRLKMMTQRRTGAWRWTVAGGLAAAGAMVVLACETPAPTNVNGPAPAEEVTATATTTEEGREAASGPVEATYRVREVEATEIEIVSGARGVVGRVALEGSDGLRIRGTIDLSSGEDGYLLYVDGVRVDGGLDAAGVGADDIVRAELVGMPDAEELYGPEARRGVVRVYTKEGTEAGGGGQFTVREIREQPAGRLSPLDELGQEAPPLIYIDGVRVDHQPRYDQADDPTSAVLSTIRPEDIERIEVTKGADAEELYGAEASVGVIEIFTKEGSGARARRPNRVTVAPAREIRQRRPSTVTPRETADGSSPLIYVDGVRLGYEGAAGDPAERVLRTIDPDDIERIEVIKGTEAEDRYGADAAGGVILIFTKGGGASAPGR